VRRVTADSNILVSAFLRGGKPLELLELARAGHIELSVSQHILNETARVLSMKFSVPADDVEAFGNEVRGFSRLVTPTETFDAVPQDSTDNPILECAVEPGSETVVTGDAHLLSLGDFRGIRIQRVADFLGSFHAR
jgi:uncharacterized protein